MFLKDHKVRSFLTLKLNQQFVLMAFKHIMVIVLILPD